MRLVIICGQGEFPVNVVENALKRCNAVIVIFLKGQQSEKNRIVKLLSQADIATQFHEIDIGSVALLLNIINQNFITHITFSGGIKRPSVFHLSPDEIGKKWLKEIGKNFFLGDDSLLKSVLNLFKKEGLNIVDPSFFLAEKTEKYKNLGMWEPKPLAFADISRGCEILDALSLFDVGQSIIVQDGVVLGIEGNEGTAELISRIKNYKISQHGGVLVKKSKLNQELRIDKPFIGEKTVRQSYESGLCGIAFEVSGCILFDVDNVIKIANELNLFVWGF